MTNTIPRWLAFYLVGGVGILVQLCALWVLASTVGVHYAAAAVAATELAILHNFVWHVRWTWRGRARTPAAIAGALARFHLSNGALSLLVTPVLMLLLAGVAGVHYLAANLVAIASCSIFNFLACDRFVFRRCCN
jgi:putative flippase GtrA